MEIRNSRYGYAQREDLLSRAGLRLGFARPTLRFPIDNGPLRSV